MVTFQICQHYTHATRRLPHFTTLRRCVVHQSPRLAVSHFMSSIKASLVHFSDVWQYQSMLQSIKSVHVFYPNLITYEVSLASLLPPLSPHSTICLFIPWSAKAHLQFPLALLRKLRPSSAHFSHLTLKDNNCGHKHLTLSVCPALAIFTFPDPPFYHITDPSLYVPRVGGMTAGFESGQRL